MKKIIYLTGAPGSGKTSVAREFHGEGFEVFYELVEKFPAKKFPEPRSYDTSKYIFEQNVKRDKLIKMSKKDIIIVDRHPHECILITKGLLKNKEDFDKIEKLYLGHTFCDGKIVKIICPKKTHKKRYLSKEINLINKSMIYDASESFKDYNQYFDPDFKIKSDNMGPREIYLSIIKNVLSDKDY
jgi:hypothetical protein